MYQSITEFAILSCLFAYAHGFGYLCEPQPRKITHDYMQKLPEDMQKLAPEEVMKLPIGFIHDKYGPETGKKYEQVDGKPCNGVPASPNAAQTCSPGQSINVAWKLDKTDKASCEVAMICPEHQYQKVLWSGMCGNVAGVTEQKVSIPSEMGPTKAGDCFIQWNMVCSNNQQHVTCADVVVEAPSQNQSSPPEAPSPPEATSESHPEERPVAETCMPSTITITNVSTATEVSTCTVTSTQVSSVVETITETMPVTETNVLTETLPPMTITETQVQPTTITETAPCPALPTVQEAHAQPSAESQPSGGAYQVRVPEQAAAAAPTGEIAQAYNVKGADGKDAS